VPQQGSKVGRKSGFIAPSAVCWHSADNAGKKPPAHPPYALSGMQETGFDLPICGSQVT